MQIPAIRVIAQIISLAIGADDRLMSGSPARVLVRFYFTNMRELGCVEAFRGPASCIPDASVTAVCMPACKDATRSAPPWYVPPTLHHLVSPNSPGRITRSRSH